MGIDLQVKAQDLLEALANSIHDRDPNNKQFCFNIAEVQVTQQWLENTLKEFLEKVAEY